MIKLLICDGDGTLGLPNPSSDIRTLIEVLDEFDIKIAVATNNTKARIIEAFHKADIDIPDIIVTKTLVGGKPKPAPEYIDKIEELSGIDRNEMILIGDDGITDIMCAINSGVLPFSTYYSISQKNEAELGYGIPINTPEELIDWIVTFGRQDSPYFGWTYNKECSDTGTRIDIRALIGTREEEVNKLLIKVLKNNQRILYGSKQVNLQYLLFMYLLSQCYLSNLTSDVDLITVYPGHIKGKSNKLLERFSVYMSQLFKDRYIKDLIVRHKSAPQSSLQGDKRDVLDQFNTIFINPSYEDKIKGKTILVLDDFTTAGYSLECARRMLINAGASHVIGIAIAKFRAKHSATIIGKSWNSFKPSSFRDAHISEDDKRGDFHKQADDYFHNEILGYYK